MIGCLRTRVRNQPIIALYFESENVLKFYNLEASCLLVFKMIAKLESTQCNAQQNKDKHTPTNTGQYIKQKINNNKRTALERAAVEATEGGS